MLAYADDVRDSTCSAVTTRARRQRTTNSANQARATAFEQSSTTFEQRLSATEPRSIRSLVDDLGGDQSSGRGRDNLTEEVEAAVASFFDAAYAMFGEERAAVLTLRMVARDPSYKVPDWFKEKLRLHREACEEEFHCPDHQREDDFSDFAHDAADVGRTAALPNPNANFPATAADLDALRKAQGVSVPRLAAALAVTDDRLKQILRTRSKPLPPAWSARREACRVLGL